MPGGETAHSAKRLLHRAPVQVPNIHVNPGQRPVCRIRRERQEDPWSVLVASLAATVSSRDKGRPCCVQSVEG